MTPGRLKRRTTGQYRQDGGRWYLLNHQVQQFEGRRIGPVQIFQDEQERLSLSSLQEDCDNGFQGLLPLTLW